ncbi:rhodanese-like domain-containing protein [Magnetovibrio sp. PR-2]|uniref:rhodanese-like domain-containing protein n=1 Tax=Magnetovibrio sp. PR-2 TaxID=3120356 RepID=UPI002FCDF67A
MSYTDVDITAAQDLLKQEGLIVIDTRTAHAQSQGQLPGAQAASDELMMKLMKSRRTNPPVLVYCYEGNSSRDMCQFIAGLGLTQVYNLAGGWKAWTAAPA